MRLRFLGNSFLILFFCLMFLSFAFADNTVSVESISIVTDPVIQGHDVNFSVVLSNFTASVHTANLQAWIDSYQLMSENKDLPAGQSNYSVSWADSQHEVSVGDHNFTVLLTDSNDSDLTDNQLSSAVKVYSGYDIKALSITASDYSPDVNDAVVFTGILYNNSDLEIPSFNYCFQVGINYQSCDTVNTFSVGGVVQVQTTVVWSNDINGNSVTLIADVNDLVEEIYENNNIAALVLDLNYSAPPGKESYSFPVTPSNTTLPCFVQFSNGDLLTVNSIDENSVNLALVMKNGTTVFDETAISENDEKKNYGRLLKVAKITDFFAQLLIVYEEQTSLVFSSCQFDYQTFENQLNQCKDDLKEAKDNADESNGSYMTELGLRQGAETQLSDCKTAKDKCEIELSNNNVIIATFDTNCAAQIREQKSQDENYCESVKEEKDKTIDSQADIMEEQSNDILFWQILSIMIILSGAFFLGYMLYKKHGFDLRRG